MRAWKITIGGATRRGRAGRVGSRLRCGWVACGLGAGPRAGVGKVVGGGVTHQFPPSDGIPAEEIQLGPN